MKELILKTEIESANFYVSSLAIGILEGMKSGEVPLECGIWSLARPMFWEALKESKEIDACLVEKVASLDELDALQTIGGDVHTAVEELLNLLKTIQKESLKSESSLAISSSVQTNS